MNDTRELNLDGLVGPTHHYGGLAAGNLASQAHRHTIASPRAAALEGLRKMKALADRGVPQAVLPPQPRPALATLRALGFTGSDAEIVQQAHREAADWLHSIYSASSMWAANAATVTPSADSTDGRVHITPANLISQFHRSLEPINTAATLRQLFDDPQHFAHHPPLPATRRFADEGAANHLRLTPSHGQPGLEIFVFGFDPTERAAALPQRLPTRQSADAGRAIARRHHLPLERCVLIQQNPDAIDAGVFHNDVISLANESVLFYHQRAFQDTSAAIETIGKRYEHVCGEKPTFIEVPDATVSLEQAVASYLFNSQLLTRPDGSMLMVCPEECRRDEAIQQYLDDLVAASDNPIAALHFAEVRQSMQNGGGPACLRLRVPLTEAQQQAMHPGVWLDDILYEALRQCIEHHYRESLRVEDLADPALIDESRAATDAIRQVLDLSLT